MTSTSLIRALPDFAAFVGRDGVIQSHLGGRFIEALTGQDSFEGRNISELWPEGVATRLRQIVRRALTDRAPAEVELADGTRHYQALARPQGRERALLVIRDVTAARRQDIAAERAAAPAHGANERRGFLGRLKQAVADAALRERPLAICMIYVSGLADIGRIIDFTVSEQALTIAIRRLQSSPATIGSGDATWSIGQIGDELLVAVIEDAQDHESLWRIMQGLCASIAEPIEIGGTTFTLVPSAGVAVLGEDASSPRELLEHARSAMLEARRAGRGEPQFYSDTLRLRPAARLDFEHELRGALSADQLGLRYQGRHGLASGRMQAVQVYLRWRHPLRGDVRPAEFLPIANATGLATSVSRWALKRLGEEWPLLRERHGVMRVSFGALRQHLASETLDGDVRDFLAAAGLAPQDLELRVAERTVAGLAEPERTLGRLADLGVAVVIDEYGRGTTSLARLARLPVAALHIDRSIVTALDQDPAALPICRAVIGIAGAFGLGTFAAGVDTERRRALLLEAGCEQGLGDLYGQLSVPASEADPAPADSLRSAV